MKQKTTPTRPLIVNTTSGPQLRVSRTNLNRLFYKSHTVPQVLRNEGFLLIAEHTTAGGRTFEVELSPTQQPTGPVRAVRDPNGETYRTNLSCRFVKNKRGDLAGCAIQGLPVVVVRRKD